MEIFNHPTRSDRAPLRPDAFGELWSPRSLVIKPGNTQLAMFCRMTYQIRGKHGASFIDANKYHWLRRAMACFPEVSPSYKGRMEFVLDTPTRKQLHVRVPVEYVFLAMP